MNKFVFSGACALFSFTMVNSSVYGDFGSRHREMHQENSDNQPSQGRGDRNERSESAESGEPFNFEEIGPVVSLLSEGAVEEELGSHVDQEELESLDALEAFVTAFVEGDELFEIDYNSLDGVGVNVGNGKRFTSLPRLDLDGPMEWANVLPHRMTGPNGTSCISCHNTPVADGGGQVNDNTIRIAPDRRQKGFIERQPPHLFGMGAIQLLAEEMTIELQAQRDAAVDESLSSGQTLTVDLTSKGVDFGSISVRNGEVEGTNLTGIDSDLVVKPFEWKGLTASVRDFVRGAAHQELGMQAVELVGGEDSDFDGVVNELTVGDITALAIYNAGQPRPVTKVELNEIIDSLNADEIETYGLPLSASEIASISSGEQAFIAMQCASCHTPSMTVSNTLYREPSSHPEYSDAVFPAGAGVRMPVVQIDFDITSNILDNDIVLASGQTLGEFEMDPDGGAFVRLYGDLKRHDMGEALAEEIDEGYVGASVFLTENLWGVGSTAPYLHDARATTLAEAILFHGGDAQSSRDLFEAASTAEKRDLISFLDNLVLYLAP